MIHVKSETEIDAPAEAVWSVLTDLPGFAAWNPFIRKARGTTALGGDVHVRVRPSLGVPLRFHAKVTSHEPNKLLRWKGHVLASWLASGDHTFEVEQLPGGRSRFVQHETFGGLLPKLAAHLLAREAQRGFDAMNQALRERVQATEKPS